MDLKHPADAVRHPLSGLNEDAATANGRALDEERPKDYVDIKDFKEEKPRDFVDFVEPQRPKDIIGPRPKDFKEPDFTDFVDITDIRDVKDIVDIRDVRDTPDIIKDVRDFQDIIERPQQL
jgi:hypothetical protein